MPVAHGDGAQSHKEKRSGPSESKNGDDGTNTNGSEDGRDGPADSERREIERVRVEFADDESDGDDRP